LFKWVLSDPDDFVRAEGVKALAKLGIKVSLPWNTNAIKSPRVRPVLMLVSPIAQFFPSSFSSSVSGILVYASPYIIF
jgi:hypothetical protein